MKKTLLLLASAALLFAGCAKELESPDVGGDTVEVSFTAAVPNQATKATIDNDGAAAKVNHWLMVIFDKDGNIFGKDERDNVTAGTLTQTFGPIRLVKNQTYQVVFWADTKGEYTITTGDSKTFTVKPAANTASKDSRDAFTYSQSYTSSTTETVSAKLYRPFAQMNVITTDLAALYATMEKGSGVYSNYAPKSFKASVKIPQSYNVFTQTPADPETTAVDLTADACYGDYSAHAANTTLFMDYIFASADQKDLVDVAFSFKSNGAAIAYDFNNVPLQKNYRTNIIGDFLSNATTWTVEIKPEWETPEKEYIVVNDIKGANEVIASAVASNESEINVKFTTQPNDAGVPNESENQRAIVTTNLKESTTLNILVEAETKSLYIGDYTCEYNTTVVTCGTNDAVVNVNIPSDSKITTLVINAPSKTVYLNDQLLETTGQVTNLDAYVSRNTLIIQPGQIVNKLAIHQGGLEIHGTVNEASVQPTSTTEQVVFVRDCENLNEEKVYNNLVNYIDEAYAGYKNADGTWDIKPANVSNVTKHKGYATLAEAVNGASEGDVIKLLNGIEVTATTSAAQWTVTKSMELNLNGKNIAVTGARAFHVATGTLTLSGTGEISATSKGTVSVSGSSHVDENGFASSSSVIRVGSDNTTGAGITVGANVTVSSDFCYGISYFGKGQTQTITINGKVAVTGYNSALSGNGSDGYNCANVTIADGAVISASTPDGAEASTAIYKPETGTMTIGKATITGPTAIGIKCGTLRINGATLAGNGKYGSTTPYSNGLEADGSAILIENNKDYGLRGGSQSDADKTNINIAAGTTLTSVNAFAINETAANGSTELVASVTITGGSFTGNSEKAALSFRRQNDNVFISGGTFSSDVTYWCAEDYAAFAQGTTPETWNVESRYWTPATEYATSTVEHYSDEGHTDVKKVTISSEAELALFAKSPVDGENSAKGHTVVVLTQDLDLAGNLWAPIKMSCVDFYGNGHTISNAIVNKRMSKNVGIFGEASISTVKGLVIDNAFVAGINHVAAVAGDGLCGHLIDCTVKNSTLISRVCNSDDGDKAGAICGYLSGESDAEATGCKAEKCTVIAYRDLGGLVGYANGTAKVEGNTVTNCSVINNQTVNYKNYTMDSKFDANEIIGETSTGATVSDNTATNVTISRVK